MKIEAAKTWVMGGKLWQFFDIQIGTMEKLRHFLKTQMDMMLQKGRERGKSVTQECIFLKRIGNFTL